MSKRRTSYCDDWSCPARPSCAHHFGRSLAYARMSERHPPTMHGPDTPYDRHASEDRQSCENYRFDRQKKWLMPRPGDIDLIHGVWP